MRVSDGTAPWKAYHYLIIGVLAAFGLLILFAASAYQQAEQMIIVVENQSGRPMQDMSLCVVGEEQTVTLWKGDLAAGETASVKGESKITGALRLKAIRDGQTIALTPVGYVAPGFDAHHRFILKADSTIEHMVATGIIPEWRHFQTYGDIHEQAPVLAGQTR